MPKSIHGRVRDLGEALCFVLGEHEVMPAVGGESGLLFIHEMEKIDKRLQGIIDFVSKRSRNPALACGSGGMAFRRSALHRNAGSKGNQFSGHIALGSLVMSDTGPSNAVAQLEIES